MPISLDVVTRLNDTSARTAAQNAQRHFDQASRNVGANFDRNLSSGFDKAARNAEKYGTAMQRSMNRAADATGRVRLEQEKYNKLVAQGDNDRVRMIQQSERLAAARRNEASAVKAATAVHMDYHRSLQQVGEGAGNASTGVAQLGASVRNLASVGGPVAIAVLASGIVYLGGVAASASQAIGLLPGVLGAAGAAFGTLKLATMGFSDALDNIRDPEEFARSLQSLSPNAQQAARALQGLLPAFDQLKNATQDALFAGMGPQINQLANTYLPVIQRMTTGVASAFGQMFSGVTDQLMTPETQAAMQNFLGNVSTAFQNLAPAAAPLTQAFSELMSVGSDFLPDLATAATEAARAFSEFITEASRSGDLSTSIREGLDTLKQLVPIVGSVKDMFMALAPAGQDILPDLAAGARALADAMPAIVTGFTAWKDTIGFVQDAVTVLLPDLSMIGTVAGTVADFASGSMDRVVNAMNRMLEPIRAAIDLANRLPGVDIANIPTFATGGAPQPVPGVLGGGANAQRQRRGLAPVVTGAGLDPFTGAPTLGGAGQAGALGVGQRNTGWGPSRFEQYGVTGPVTGGVGAGAGAKTSEGLVPNAANLQQILTSMFPGIQVNADVGRKDSFGEHASGEALDIMVGNNQAMGDQINRFLLQNADSLGLQYNLWRQMNWDPSGEVSPMPDRGSPTANHMDHVHARVKPGEAASGNYMPLGGQAGRWDGKSVTVSEFGPSARGDLQDSIGQIGAKIDDDFGFSKGLPGLIENATKMLANLAFAPAVGALSGVQAGLGFQPGSAGSGLFGMAAPGMGYTASGSGGGGSGMFAGGAPSLSAMGPAGLGGGGGPWSANWDAMAQKESSGNWGINTGNGYFGGLQFAPSSWEAAGGTQYAPRADMATPVQQKLAAEELLRQQGPGAWPNTFTPAAGAAHGTGAGMAPGPAGFGGPAGLPGAAAAAGGAAPDSQLGSRGANQGSPGGGGFNGLGGLPMAAINSAISSAGGMMPGGGQAAAAAAQTLIQLGNRAIGFAGQAAGIGMGGLIETFLPNNSALADPSKSWLGRVIGGFAGAKPATPNAAAKPAPVAEQAKDAGKGVKDGRAATAEAMVKIEHMHNNGPDGQGVAQDIARNQLASAAAGVGG